MTPDLPLVSIAMPMRNAEKTLALALKSILLQTYPNWELLLIDDGSTDNSLAIARNYSDPRITIIRHGTHKGLAVRLNEAIDMRRGKYFARLDADDVAFPERLEQQVGFLERNVHVDLVGTGAAIFGDDGNLIGVFPFRQAHEEICKRPWSGFYLAHPSWMGKASWFRKHRYRPAMLKAQDQDLLLRSHKSSTFACLPQILTGYRQERISLQKSLVSRYHFSKALARHGLQNRQYLTAAAAIAGQVAKGAFETFALSTHQDRVMLRHRALPATGEIKEEWERLWKSLRADEEK